MKPQATLAALGFVTLLAGCLTPASSDCVSTGGINFPEQELRVLDHGAFDDQFQAIQPFFEKRSGAKLVQVAASNPGDMLQKAKDARGNPIADVIWGIDNALFGEAIRADILEPYQSPGMGDLLVPTEPFLHRGRLHATPGDFGFITVNLDKALNDSTPAAELPKTLRDLASPRWARQFVVEDPRFESTGLGFLIASVGNFGENDDYDYLDFWGELYRNGALVAKDWTEAYVVHFSGGYGKWEEGHVGDRGIVVAYSTSPAYEANYTEDKKPPTVSFESAKTTFRQIETVAVLKCTKHLPLAQAFVDFVLTRDFQDLVSLNNAMYPVLPDATMITEFRTVATPPQNLISAPMAQDDLNRNVVRWLNEWTEHYQAAHA